MGVMMFVNGDLSNPGLKKLSHHDVATFVNKDATYKAEPCGSLKSLTNRASVDF